MRTKTAIPGLLVSFFFLFLSQRRRKSFRGKSRNVNPLQERMTTYYILRMPWFSLGSFIGSGGR